MVTTKWKADPAHTELQFKVRHLMITNITGYFKKFDIEVDTEDDDITKPNKILVTADIDSIDTKSEQRDTHLKSSDFFASEENKQLKFEGNKVEKQANDDYKLYGNLTIRSVTKPVVLDVEYAGIVQDPYGQTKAGFTVKGKINRKDYGLMWNAVTEAGQVVASDEVRITCEVQLIKQV
jgi:polyisoprenoid-binding protein YceI